MYPVLASIASILAAQQSKKRFWSDLLNSSEWSWDWGWRVHPIDNKTQWHNGVDLPAPEGTPILAPWPGVVDTATTDELNGNYIKLSHDPNKCSGTIETAFCHLSSMNVSAGDLVEAGDMIGKVGSTGKSTGPHLHFIIRTVEGSNVDGEHRKDVDPVPYLEESAMTPAQKKIHGISIVGAMLVGSALLYWWLSRR